MRLNQLLCTGEPLYQGNIQHSQFIKKTNCWHTIEKTCFEI